MDSLDYHRQTQRITHIELGLVLLSIPIFLGGAGYFKSALPALGAIVWAGLVYFWGHHKQRKLNALAEPRHTDEQLRDLGYLPFDTVVQYTDGRVVWEAPLGRGPYAKCWWRVKPQDTTNEEPENVA